MRTLFDNLAVSHKLNVGFGVVLLLLAAIVGLGYWALESANTKLREYDRIRQNSATIAALSASLPEVRRNAMNFANTGNAASAAASDAGVVAFAADIDRALGGIRNEADRQRLAAMRQDILAYGANFKQVQALFADRTAARAAMDEIGAAMRTVISQAREAALSSQSYADAAYLGDLQERLMLFRLDALRYFLAPSEASGVRVNERASNFALGLGEAQMNLLDPTRIEAINKLQTQSGPYLSAFERAAKDALEIERLVNTVNRQIAERTGAALAELVASQNGRMESIRTSAFAQSDEQQAVLVAVGAVALLLGIGFAVAIGRAIGGPLAGMTAAMGRLARREWGVEVPGLGRKDEIGAMADAVAVFKTSGQEAERLAAADAAEQFAKLRRQAAIEAYIVDFEREATQSVAHVAGSAEQLRKTAKKMAGISSDTKERAATVAAAAQQASGNVQTVAASAEELNASIGEISRQVSTSTQTASAAVAEVDRSNEQIAGLAEAARKIGDVVKLISSIAGQTNLLALNATIEAARAGDAGKGSAVVASEVKNLAAQTSKATDEIGAQVSGIQAASQTAVAAIGRIGKTITAVNEVSAGIAAAVEEQGAATAEIARSVQQAAQGTQHVSNNIGGVTQAAADAGAGAEDLLEAARELSRQSAKLQEDVGGFLAKIRAA